MPLPTNPLNIIAEILGEPASLMRNPANAEYQCPFINGQCIKRSQRMSGPYPVCTIFYGKKSDHTPRPLCVCPKRLYQIDLLGDVIANCWPGDAPANPRIAHEVQMKGFGNVDFVIADVADDNSVRQFVSVEMQAVDITGSVEPAFRALANNADETEKFSYGINWANVRKRYITQLVTKGFYHQAWESRIIAVLQTPTYDSFKKYIEFDELPAKTAGNSINFMLYDYVLDNDTGAYHLKLDRVVSTSHNSLMMAAMYRKIPDKKVFCDRIVSRMR